MNSIYEFTYVSNLKTIMMIKLMMVKIKQRYNIYRTDTTLDLSQKVEKVYITYTIEFVKFND